MSTSTIPMRLRQLAVILLILLATLASACTLNPTDGAEVTYASSAQDFSGFSTLPNSDVRLEALSAEGVWTQIGKGKSVSNDANTGGTTPLYAYSFSQVIPERYWLASSGKHVATLRMRVADIVTYTFNAEGMRCVRRELERENFDYIDLGSKCTTGSTIKLLADALAPPRLPPRQPPPPPPPPRPNPCAGAGGGCSVSPTECGDPSFIVPGELECKNNRLVCTAHHGVDYCVSGDGAACGARFGEACGVNFPCSPGGACRTDFSNPTSSQMICMEGCTPRPGCYTPADVSHANSLCL